MAPLPYDYKILQATSLPALQSKIDLLGANYTPMGSLIVVNNYNNGNRIFAQAMYQKPAPVEP